MPIDLRTLQRMLLPGETVVEGDYGNAFLVTVSVTMPDGTLYRYNRAFEKMWLTDGDRVAMQLDALRAHVKATIRAKTLNAVTEDKRKIKVAMAAAARVTKAAKRRRLLCLLT